MFDECIYLDTYEAENELDMIEEMGDLLDEEVVREKTQKILKSIETARTKLDELERRCRVAFSKALRPEKTIEDSLEEFESLKETKVEGKPTKVLLITPKGTYIDGELVLPSEIIVELPDGQTVNVLELIKQTYRV